ncbi:hypothetical protein CH286_25590 [Rhodococcus sp. WWJCD1]|nr:hypothetical protein CH286_25590 [Rhodococcus sp. WWJCD1]OZE89239.1 hypothetical protein CH302_28010 [Rhodococcus sp. 15-2388-1-1a]
MPVLVTVALLCTGLVTQLLGIALVVADIRRDRRLSRDFERRIQLAHEAEQGTELQRSSPDLPFDEDMKLLGAAIEAWAPVYDPDFQLQRTAGFRAGWTGVVLLTLGTVVNFAASVGPLV